MIWDGRSLDDQGRYFAAHSNDSESESAFPSDSPMPFAAAPPTTEDLPQRSKKPAGDIWKKSYAEQHLVLSWPLGMLRCERRRVMEEFSAMLARCGAFFSEVTPGS